MPRGYRSKGRAAVDWVLPTIGIFAAMAIAFGIGWLEAHDSKERIEASAAYEQAAKDDAERSCRGADPTAVFECVNVKAKAAYQTGHDAQDLKANQRSADSALASVFLSLFALLLSGVGVWYVKRTLDATLEAVEDTSAATEEMRKANELTERNAQRELRPYIFPSHADFKIDGSGEPIATIIIKNFGQTPAINKRGWTHTWVECFPLHDPLPDAPDDLPTSSTVIGPGASSEAVQDHGKPLNDFSRTEIEAGRAALYVYGFGTYMDIFGKEHFYRFIYFASGKGSLERGRLSPYTSGNVIDFN